MQWSSIGSAREIYTSTATALGRELSDAKVGNGPGDDLLGGE